MPLKSYKYEEGKFKVTEEMKGEFEDDGYVVIRGLLSDAELKHIENALVVGKFSDHTYGVPDGDGREAHMILWNHPGVDVTGMVGRCEKVADTCEQLLGGEVYHYHTKLMAKPAKIGGKHVWHQDYGYWYQNGNLFPNMMTVFMAIDKCTKENGCLQILKGSNKCGRIEHVQVAGQVGADMARVDELAKVLPLEYVELEPGDALFFHCNLLHCSAPNTSAARRWAFLCAYNRADNNPTKEHHHPRYTPLKKVPNSAILECQDFTTMDGKWFIDPEIEKRPGRKLAHKQ
ncbi:L-proline trans-4-hydroxylase-like [Mercenaria mercenaria]|uniref:L-proline trans-4-hydroxylase-like n=1 Tax=Mercenaria mercenaria TaxID=6596 RepID=UPI001E1D368C|nr:L-proline trans-4-hydroxylase-like [Mercenaria mercenaria]